MKQTGTCSKELKAPNMTTQKCRYLTKRRDNLGKKIIFDEQATLNHAVKPILLNVVFYYHYWNSVCWSYCGKYQLYTLIKL